MVKVRFNDKDEMGIQITEYQFPTSDDKGYDGNWLNVYLEVNSQIGKWNTVDPCLLTWELERLITVLEKTIDKYHKKPVSVGFIEPNIEFVLRPMKSDETNLKVIFSHESRPKTWPEDEECYLEGTFTSQGLQEIKNGLELELKKYPKRV